MRCKPEPGFDIVYDLIAVDTIMQNGEFHDILIDNDGKAIYLSAEVQPNLSLRLRIRATRNHSRIDIIDRAPTT